MVDRANRSQSRKSYEVIRQDAAADISNQPSLGDEIEPDLEDLENLEAELGMEEVQLDQVVIDTVAADDTDDNLDANDDGVADEADDEVIDDRPQKLTQSYGTGLQGQPSDRAGRFSRRDTHTLNEPEFDLTGGDVDANYEDADAVGEEAVGGTVATPDQDIVEDIAVAAGVQTDDRSFLRVHDMLEQRDDQRWELDPKSSEDYQNRRSE